VQVTVTETQVAICDLEIVISCSRGANSALIGKVDFFIKNAFLDGNKTVGSVLKKNEHHHTKKY
jgi:hypothetical protein